MYVEDGDYIKDIEINDLRNRYTLTKGSTQKMVIPLAIQLIFQALFCQLATFPFVSFCPVWLKLTHNFHSISPTLCCNC